MGRLLNIVLAWFWAAALCFSAEVDLPNRTLSLKEAGDFVRLPSGILGPLKETTVECWVKWDHFLYYGQPFGFAESDLKNVFGFNTHSTTNDPQFFIYHQNEIHVLRLNAFFYSAFVHEDQWYHFALSTGPKGMRLVCNGIVLQESSFSEGVAAIRNDTANFLGRSQWNGNADFNGELDEVRVWDRVLSLEEIRENQFRRLSGKEPGLVAYWNFDDGTAADLSPSGRHGALEGNASCIAGEIPKSVSEIAQPSVLSGRVTDTFGNPLSGAIVEVYCGSEISMQTKTDVQGRYKLQFINACQSIDLWCGWKSLGEWKSNITILPGLNSPNLFILKNQIHLKGSITALDNSPLLGVSVQALRRSSPSEPFEIARKAQTDRDGQFSFSNVRPGDYIVRCHTGQEFLYYQSPNHSPVEIDVGTDSQDLASILKVQSEVLIESVQFRFPIPHAGRWRNFTYLDGLGSSAIHSVYEAADGMMWVGTSTGIACFDGRSFRRIENPDGPLHTEVRSIIETPIGTLWFATKHGLYQYANKRFRHYTTDDGLPASDVLSLAKSESGVLCCGTALGICFFDGSDFRSPNANLQSHSRITDIEYLPNGKRMFLTTKGAAIEQSNTLDWYSGLESPLGQGALSSLVDSKHRVWFITASGVSEYRFDRNLLHWSSNLSSLDGLPEVAVTAMLEDTDGSIWFGTRNGSIFRLDQNGMTTISTLDELASNQISVMQLQSNQNIWVGTLGGGLSLLERSIPKNYDRGQGIPARKASSIVEDRSGHLWFGFEGGGVSRYDGSRFQNYSLRDSHALPHDTITSLALDDRDRIWAGTDDGYVGLLSNDEIVPVNGLDPTA